MSDTHAQTVAFVRETTIPESPPPAAETGAIKWLRQNLFATPANSLLTVAALYVIWVVLSGSLPWIFGGLWTTTSLAECREILQGRTGACFSVLSERWNQLLYGFKYPADQYWRPNLAFLLLFFAAAPVLFFDLPRKMLIFTGLYPFLAYWLIWGGSLLVPIVALLGFLGGALVYQRFIKTSFAAGFFGGIACGLRYLDRCGRHHSRKRIR